MRILITGAGGQLAYDLKKTLDGELIALNHAELDITDADAVRARLQSDRPKIVINTAAFTRVDDCEKQIEKAFAVNAFGVLHLARACQELGSVLVQISTDYVFSDGGGKPHTEDEAPRPPNVYGASKLAGEHFAQAYCERHFVIRSAGLFGVAGSSGKGGNFVETMLRLAATGKPIRVVNDQVLTPTFTGDLAPAILTLLKTERYGLFHLTNAGACSWFEFAAAIFRTAGLSPDLEPIPSSAYPLPARRPAYSVLDNRRAISQGIRPLRPWQEALKAYLALRQAKRP